MALHSETSIYAAAIDFAKAAVPIVIQMPRATKHHLGDRIVDEALWLPVLILRLNKARDAAKLPIVEEIVEHIELAEVALRISRELGYIKNPQFSRLLPLTASIAKQAYGIRNHFAPA